MEQPIVYLSFNGNCREAMTFYQQCLGGELTLQRVNQVPVNYHWPRGIGDYILEATLSGENMVIMGTDLIDTSINYGNSVSIFLRCNTKEEMINYYNKLSQAAQVTYPVTENAYGGMNCMLTDRYGIHWLLRSKI